MTEWRVPLMMLIISYVHCKDCVIFDFEKDFNSSFSNEINVCNDVRGPMWNIGRYEDISIDSPDPESSKFVYPGAQLSCSSSYTFEIAEGGLLEINMYLKSLPWPTSDQVTIIANQEMADGPDANVGIHTIVVSGDDFINGWRTIKMILTGRGTYRGYIAFIGMLQTGAVILIDSLRYVSPTIKEEECIIYEKITISTISTVQTEVVSTGKDTEPSDPSTITATFTPEIKTTTDIITTELNLVSTTQSEDPEITENVNQTTLTYPNESTKSTITEKEYEPTTSSTDSTISNPNESTKSPITENEYESTTFSTDSTISNPNESTKSPITENEYEPTTFSTDSTISNPNESTKSTITDKEYEPTTFSTDSTISNPNESTKSTITEKEYEPTTSSTDSTISSDLTKYTEDNTVSTTKTTSQMTTTDTSTSTDTTTTPSATSTDVTQITIYPESTTFTESESISTAEDIGSSTTEAINIFTTEEYISENPENTTKSPSLRPRYTFWNAFTIIMVIILILILVVITAIVWYYIGKRSSPRPSEIILPYFEEPPRNLTIPRVSKVWSDSSTINRLSSILKME